MLLFNTSAVVVGSQMMSLGCQTTPAAEVALVALLETAFGPLGTYLAVGEEPSKQTAIAGALIVAILAAHSFYELHLERARKETELVAGTGGTGGAAPAAEEGEGVELLRRDSAAVIVSESER
jgi:hypothetical protein